MTVTATPKNYRDGLSAVFTLTPESGVPQTAAGTLLAGNAFRAELAVPLEMEYQDFSVSVSFTLDGKPNGGTVPGLILSQTCQMTQFR